jgi:hypothetical protein
MNMTAFKSLLLFNQQTVIGSLRLAREEAALYSIDILDTNEVAALEDNLMDSNAIPASQQEALLDAIIWFVEEYSI